MSSNEGRSREGGEGRERDLPSVMSSNEDGSLAKSETADGGLLLGGGLKEGLRAFDVVRKSGKMLKKN
jgi:hypothetical protein